MAPRPIIVDCDTGRDDALAIALALASPAEFDVLGITTVAGNIPVSLAWRNSRFVCELCGRGDVRVFQGASGPLNGRLVTAEHVHGQSGIEGVAVAEPRGRPETQPAVEFLIETLRAARDNSVTLIVTGPATNIALAIAAAPGLLPKIREISLMGGAWREVGNVTPSAEFNVYVDPQAANMVLHCGRPITMIGLDATHKVLARPAHAEHLAKSGSSAANALAPLLRVMPSTNKARYCDDAIPIHDPCTLVVLLQPDLFTLRHVNVEVEQEGRFTTGATVVDRWNVSGRQPNAQWAVDVDGEAVLNMLTARLMRLP